jgi:pilus assembly protein CpaE
MMKRFADATLVSLAADAELSGDIAKQAKVLVLEVDPSSAESLRRIGKLRAAREDLPIIAALSKADVSLVRTLVRQGITDVAELPFAPDELASQILEASTRLAELAPKGALAPMISVIRSAGGSGATTVLTHLAAELAKVDQTGKGVCVIDLDLQSGDVAAFIGQDPKVTVLALLEAGDRLDTELLRSTITSTPYHFSIIAAPDAIAPLDTVDVEQLLRVLSFVRRQFGYVLVDLPADWTDWSLSTVVASTDVLLVTDLSIASLRQARRRLDLLRSVGLGKHQLKVIANRMERRLFKTIGVDEVTEALDCEVIATLSADPATLREAQDQGLLVTDVAHRNKFASEIRALAGLLASVKE